MKRKPVFLAGLCGILILCCAALGEGDGLISLRYLTDTFIPQTVQQGEAIQDRELQEAYDQAIQRAEQTAGSSTGSGSYSPDLSPRTLSQGSTVTLETGSCFLLISGSGTVRHTGTVVDTSSAAELPSGAALSIGHRYLVAEETQAEFTVSTAASAGFTGSYRLGQGGSAVPPAGDLPFTDVKSTDWFHDSIAYVYQNGLFSGMDETSFGPNRSMDRSMLVTVLYRLAGSPEDQLSAAQASFIDVRDKDWFAPYVRWAASQNITAGTGDGLFSPGQPVTRQQVMVLLYNFGTRYMGLNLYQRADLSGYSDLSRVDGWGLEAMQWAVGAGILSSTTPGELVLEPQSSATRAQVAVMLQNFAEKFL